MLVTKPFLRGRKAYRVGDAFDEDLSATERAHYLRHGMLSETKPADAGAKSPAETKPARPPQEKK